MNRLMFAVFMIGAASCSAAVISEVTSGSAIAGGSFFLGQSFLTPSGGPWNAITFNFYSDVPAVTPGAGGTAYLLSQLYAGTPAALSSATPGFLAASTGIVGGRYIFDPTVTLFSLTSYFIYANGVFQPSAGSVVPDAQAFGASTAGSPFVSAGGMSLNFTVAGDAVVPEPTTIGLTLTGLGSILLLGNRRRSRLQAA